MLFILAFPLGKKQGYSAGLENMIRRNINNGHTSLFLKYMTT
jgi:hypothetical protein